MTLDQGGTSDHIFVIHGWLIVGIGQTNVVPVQEGFVYNILRVPAGMPGKYPFINLTDFAVLTEIATQVASETPDGQNVGTGEKMVERLLFNGIRGDGG